MDMSPAVICAPLSVMPILAADLLVARGRQVQFFVSGCAEGDCDLGQWMWGGSSGYPAPEHGVVLQRVHLLAGLVGHGDPAKSVYNVVGYLVHPVSVATAALLIVADLLAGSIECLAILLHGLPVGSPTVSCHTTRTTVAFRRD